MRRFAGGRAGSRMPRRAGLARLGAVLLACGLLATLDPVSGRALPRGAAAPFRVKSVSGAMLDLDSLRVRGPVVLDFWATWCKPCLAALPEIEALWKKYRERGLTVVGVSEDGPRNYAKVRPFVVRLGMSYPIVLDADEGLQQKYQVRALPTTVLVDRDGKIARFTQGYRPGETKALEAAIEELIGVAQPDAPADSATAPRDTSSRGR